MLANARLVDFINLKTFPVIYFIWKLLVFEKFFYHFNINKYWVLFNSNGKLGKNIGLSRKAVILLSLQSLKHEKCFKLKKNDLLH